MSVFDTSLDRILHLPDYEDALPDESWTSRGHLIPLVPLLRHVCILIHSGKGEAEVRRFLNCLGSGECYDVVMKLVDERCFNWTQLDYKCCCTRPKKTCPYWYNAAHREAYKNQWYKYWFPHYHQKGCIDEDVLVEMMGYGTVGWIESFEFKYSQEMNHWDEKSDTCYCGEPAEKCPKAKTIRQYREEDDPRGYKYCAKPQEECLYPFPSYLLKPFPLEHDDVCLDDGGFPEFVAIEEF